MEKKKVYKIIAMIFLIAFVLTAIAKDNKVSALYDGQNIVCNNNLWPNRPTLPIFDGYDGQVYCISADLTDATELFPGRQIYKVTKIDVGTSYSTNNGTKYFSEKQITMLQYVMGYGVSGDVKDATRNIVKQINSWYIGNPNYNLSTKKNNGSAYSVETGLSQYANYYYYSNGYSSATDLYNEAYALYNKALDYYDAMKVNYSTREKIPEIYSNNATAVLYDGDTYKVGPFYLNYNTDSLKTIAGIKATGSDGTEFGFASGMYMLENGTRTDNVPASGTNFYLMIKNLKTTKLKVTLYHNYETYANITLYKAQLYGDASNYQTLILAEGTPKRGQGETNVELDVTVAKEWGLTLYKSDSTNRNGTASGIAGAKFSVTLDGSNIGTYTTAYAVNPQGKEFYRVPVKGTINIGQTRTLVIKEIEAPSGYKLLDGEVTVKVSCDSSGNISMKASSTTLVGETPSGHTDYMESWAQRTETPNTSNYKINFDKGGWALKFFDKPVEKVSTYNISFIKKDSLFKETISGAKFKVTSDAGLNTEVTANSKGEFSITSNANNTSTEKITITEIYVDGKYKLLSGPITITVKKKVMAYGLYEYYVADEATVSGSGVTNATYKFSNSLSNNSMIGAIGSSIVIEDEPNFNAGKYAINLNKADAIDGRKLEGASFYVKVTDSNTQKVLVNNTYKTNANGILSITGIPVTLEGEQVIEITETEAPTYYEKLSGKLKLKVTKKINKESWSYTVSSVTITNDFEISSDGKKTSVYENKDKEVVNSIDLTVTNVRKKIKLDGYVWEDEKGGKESTVNGTKDSNENTISGLQVYLHTDGNAIYSKDPATWSTTTNSNGHYEFEIPMGAKYYVEFKYNGYNYQHTKYTKYTGASSPITSNATETEKKRDEFNNRLAEITPTTSINNVKVSNKDNELKATELGNNEIYAISAYVGGHGEEGTTKFSETAHNINLGITKREDADLAIRKDVYSAKFSIKGKTQTYMYNRNNKEVDSKGNSYWDISVRRSDSEYYQNYSRAVKKADYNYAEIDKNQALTVEVTYRIVIKNQSGSLDSNITELVDYYDKDYTFKDAYIENGGKIKTSTTSRYSHTTGISNYNKIYFELDQQIKASGKALVIYANFTVNQDSSGKLKLDKDDGKGNMVEIMGYTTKYGTNAKSPNANNSNTYVEYKSGDVAGRIDVDSNPGNATSVNQNTFEDDTDRAPYIKFELAETERDISGITWIDERNQVQEDTAVGDGIRGNNEATKDGVKVELWNADTNSIEKVYNGSRWVEAKTETANGGQYSIKGFVPGNYYVKFIYDDGQNYKSTTFNYSEVCPDFNINNPDIIGTFKETSTNYSDARDIWSKRENLNNQLNGEQNASVLANYDANVDKTMEAITGNIAINIEKDTNDTNSSFARKYEISNVDFGLQERPKAQLMLTKKVKNVQVILANGNILFDASGRTTNVMWKDKTEHTHTYNNNLMATGVRANNQTIQLTMDEELKHGATIKITYGIVVQNIGEADYASKKFYYSGKKDGNEHVVTTKVGSIVDYIGASGTSDENTTKNNLTFNKTDNGKWETITPEKIRNAGLVTLSKKDLIDYPVILTYTFGDDEHHELTPVISNEEQSKTDEVTLKLTQVMTIDTNTDQASYSNMAEVLTLQNAVGRKMQYSTPGNQNPNNTVSEVDTDVSQAVTILPPFGETYIYYALAGSVAIILIAGIVLIKVKVLKPKQ